MEAAVMTVANEILNQLGGNRFIAMTGARLIVGGADYMQFSTPKVKDGSNKMRITLNAVTDLYTVETYNIRGINVTPKTTIDGVYADQLRAVFESITGLRTSL